MKIYSSDFTCPKCGMKRALMSVHPDKDGNVQCTNCANVMRGFGGIVYINKHKGEVINK